MMGTSGPQYRMDINDHMYQINGEKLITKMKETLVRGSFAQKRAIIAKKTIERNWMGVSRPQKIKSEGDSYREKVHVFYKYANL